MPAEWHPHHSTWLTWPKDPETWPDRVTQVEEIYLEMIAALTPHEIVNLLVDDDETERLVRERCSAAASSRIRFHHIQTVDSWIRDYGPNFLIGPNGESAFHDWIFNAWGNKYEDLKKDDSVPRRLEPFLKLQRFSPGIVMEGGSIEVNGAGCVLTTEQCLLNPNRNPDLSREEIEQYLKDYLGVTKVLWLGEGIVGRVATEHLARDPLVHREVRLVEPEPRDARRIEVVAREVLGDERRHRRHDLAELHPVDPLEPLGCVGAGDDVRGDAVADIFLLGREEEQHARFVENRQARNLAERLPLRQRIARDPRLLHRVEIARFARASAAQLDPGVTRDAQSLAALTALGCDVVQGYYLSRPVAATVCT